MPSRHHHCPPRVRSNLVPGEGHPRPACGLRCCRLPEQGGYPPGSGQSRGLCRAGYSHSSISLPTTRRRSSRQVSEGSDPRGLPAGRLASPPAAEARHPALLLSSWERELLPHRASASADVSRLKIAQAGSPADLSAQVTGAIQTPLCTAQWLQHPLCTWEPTLLGASRAVASSCIYIAKQSCPF